MAEKKHSNGQTYGSVGRPNHPVTKVPTPPPRKVPTGKGKTGPPKGK